jgi:hypothetical protein
VAWRGESDTKPLLSEAKLAGGQGGTRYSILLPWWCEPEGFELAEEGGLVDAESLGGLCTVPVVLA